MALWHGSGDVSFTPDEFKRIGEAILDACNRASPNAHLTMVVSIGCVHRLGDASVAHVEIRPPFERGETDNIKFDLRVS